MYSTHFCSPKSTITEGRSYHRPRRKEGSLTCPCASGPFLYCTFSLNTIKTEINFRYYKHLLQVLIFHFFMVELSVELIIHVVRTAYIQYSERIAEVQKESHESAN